MNLPDNFEPGPALERLKSLHDGHIVDNPSWWETCAAIEELAEQAATALRVAADWFEKQQEQWERAKKLEAELKKAKAELAERPWRGRWRK